MKRSPQLLAPWGEVGALHPVEISQKDTVNGSDGGRHQADRCRICVGSVCAERHHAGRATRTPGVVGFDNQHHVLRHDNDAITNNHDTQQTHPLHKMGPGEAKHLPEIRQDNSKDGFHSANNVPSNKHAAPYVSEAKGYAKIYCTGHGVYGDLYIKRSMGAFKLPHVPQDTAIFNSQDETGDGENQCCSPSVL